MKEGKAEMARELLEKELLGEKAAAAVRQKPQLIHGLFAPPTVQIANVREWNARRGWGFTDEDFVRLGEAPVWPEERLVAVTLVPYLDTVQATFDALWEIAASRQKACFRWEHLFSDPGHLFLLDGITHPGKCLRWEVIDLGANWDKKNGIAPETVRSAATSPHAGILAAASHSPKWVRVMDGVAVPFVWLPGYMATASVPGYVPRQRVPIFYFDFDIREVSLHARTSVDRFPRCAVPALRGV